MVSHRAIDYTFGNVVNQLRSTQLFALVFQLLILFMEKEHYGFSGFAIPGFFICINFGFAFMRWFQQIDGRYDAQQLLSVKSYGLKSQYAFALFSAFLLALLTHFLSPEIESGLSAFLYHLSDYVSIATSGMCMFVEVFEGARGMVGRG
ncbi:Protein R05D7.1 [Aphelenchoides avenae]|nr:Protein R05D7.1 [Aphelenchus avenae]